jgi:hypothetical protein
MRYRQTSDPLQDVPEQDDEAIATCAYQNRIHVIHLMTPIGVIGRCVSRYRGDADGRLNITVCGLKIV